MFAANVDELLMTAVCPAYHETFPAPPMFKRRKPYPNLFDKAIISYYNQHSDEYNYNTNTQKFVLATCHSELYGNLINKSKNYIIAQDGVPNNDEKYFYPIEIFGNHRVIIR